MRIVLYHLLPEVLSITLNTEKINVRIGYDVQVLNIMS